MSDERQRPIADKDCPLAQAAAGGVQWMRRLHVNGRGGRIVAVDAQAVPVVDSDGVVVGVSLLMHDVSEEITLEERCQNLHNMATRDPLTQVANRAEFDRVQAEFVKAPSRDQAAVRLIMTDIDRFKTINDTYGHQAGDEVIKAIAHLMQTFCRSGDLVADTGGEEFVLLCADCDNATGTAPEEIRVAFGLVRHQSLGQRCVTASFGVTEVQPGDTPETMLRRADRALITAKETGRNRVVQLGVGGDAAAGDNKHITATSKKRLAGNMLMKREMTSDSPLERNIEKLKGFSRRSSCRNHAHGSQPRATPHPRRSGRTALQTSERSHDSPNYRLGVPQRSYAPENDHTMLQATRITAMISPVKSRERRTVAAMERARQLVASLRSYLMATDVDGVEAVAEEEGGFWQSLRSLLAEPNRPYRKKANGKPAPLGVRRSGYVVTAPG